MLTTHFMYACGSAHDFAFSMIAFSSSLDGTLIDDASARAMDAMDADAGIAVELQLERTKCWRRAVGTWLRGMGVGVYYTPWFLYWSNE